MNLRVLLAVSLILSSACAQKPVEYSGKLPDFNLTGTDAENEVQRFRLYEGSFWSSGQPTVFESDPKQRFHSVKSMKPLWENVSPKTLERYKWAETVSYTALGLLGAAILALTVGFYETGDDRRPWFRASQYLSWTSIAANIYYGQIISYMPSRFNRDLENRFHPTINLKKEF